MPSTSFRLSGAGMATNTWGATSTLRGLWAQAVQITAQIDISNTFIGFTALSLLPVLEGLNFIKCSCRSRAKAHTVAIKTPWMKTILPDSGWLPRYPGLNRSLHSVMLVTVVKPGNDIHGITKE